MYHKKYNSIVNHYSAKHIKQIYESSCFTEKWVALEKIDGSNFSAHCNGSDVKWGYRTAMIKEGEKFQGYEPVAKKYHDDVLHAYHLCKKKFSSLTLNSIIIYGELFGGTYKHKDVPIDTSSTNIIGRVGYTPHNDFMFYDIVIRIDDNKDNDIWLSHDEIIEISKSLKNLKTVPALYTGLLTDFINIKDCTSKIPQQFASTIYKAYNLPPIINNWAEGYVIKPVKASFLSSGSRIMIKIKDKAFAEKKSVDKTKYDSSKLFSEFIDIYEYINESRLISVLSKLTDEQKKNKSMIISLFVMDTINDYIGDKDIKLTKSQSKLIKKNISKKCANLILPLF